MALPKDEGILREDVSNPEKLNLTSGRFLITAACAGSEVSMPVLNTMQGYSKHQNAKLRILPMRAHMPALQKQPAYYDEELYPFMEKGYFLSSLAFNANLKAIDLQLNPQQIEPLTGVTRIGRASLLVAHPVTQMKVLAHSSSGLPRMMHTTGVVTKRAYKANRMGVLAGQSHRLGGVIVELDKERFHLRQLQADTDGSFVDLGLRYKGNSKQKERPISLVLGDIHAGEHDPVAMRVWKDIAKLTRPRYIILHDLFNGLSINHHLSQNQLAKVNISEHVNTLEKEIAVTAQLLEEICSWVHDAVVVVVESNHNEWLSQYLTQNRWAFDTTNYKYAHSLIGHALNGFNPLQASVDPHGRAKWLNRNDDLILAGIQHGVHGDKGANGAKGSAAGLEVTHGAISYGHVHTPGILRDAWAAGTSSKLRLDYNRGASGWLHSSILTYESVSGGIGMRQLITSIEGRWRA